MLQYERDIFVLISSPVSYPVRQELFGFAFDRRSRIIISEAFSGTTAGTAVSSYQLKDDTGAISVITASLKTGETAARWITLSKDEGFAFAANTGST
jgi:hypothetical protein